VFEESSCSSAHWPLLDLDNQRRRVWAIAVKASSVATRARIYDLHPTFTSNALAAGVTCSSSSASWDRRPRRDTSIIQSLAPAEPAKCEAWAFRRSTERFAY
jgi:hypothetical protein